MQKRKWLLIATLLTLSGSAVAGDVTILTPDNVNDLVNPEFSVVAEVGIGEALVGLEGMVRLEVSDDFNSTYIMITCGNEDTPEGETPVISLHNDRRVKGWVCSTDMCKLVISAEVDLSDWDLSSGDELTTAATVEVASAIAAGQKLEDGVAPQRIVIVLIFIARQDAVHMHPCHFQICVRQGGPAAVIQQRRGELLGQPQSFVELTNRQQPHIGAQMGLDRLDNDGLLCEKLKCLLPNSLRIHLGPPGGSLSGRFPVT